jgi:hypothetical protein
VFGCALTSKRWAHINIASSRFQYAHFQIERLKNKLVVVEKEHEKAKMNNAALAHYINAKRKKEEEQKKEEARKKAEEGQSSKCLFPPAS